MPCDVANQGQADTIGIRLQDASPSLHSAELTIAAKLSRMLPVAMVSNTALQQPHALIDLCKQLIH